MPERARLKWQCRRGAVELDLWLGRFLDQHYAAAPPALQTAFLRLLDCSDEQLLRYLWRQQRPADADTEALLAIMHNP